MQIFTASKHTQNVKQLNLHYSEYSLTKSPLKSTKINSCNNTDMFEKYSAKQLVLVIFTIYNVINY